LGEWGMARGGGGRGIGICLCSPGSQKRDLARDHPGPDPDPRPRGFPGTHLSTRRLRKKAEFCQDGRDAYLRG
jgi:hypothetical protein